MRLGGKKNRQKDPFMKLASRASPKRQTTPYRSQSFDYSKNYKDLDLRKKPHFYRVGKGEQGVLLVEPYKSEILPFWRFKNRVEALKSAQSIFKLFNKYKASSDFVGMDMSRKFLQMGYTRSRRYANHSSGRKYDQNRKILPFQRDLEKAQSAKIFWKFWKKAEADPLYERMKADWKKRLG